MNQQLCARERATFTCPAGQTARFGSQVVDGITSCRPSCEDAKGRSTVYVVVMCVSCAVLLGFGFMYFHTMSTGNATGMGATSLSSLCTVCCVFCIYTVAFTHFAFSFGQIDRAPGLGDYLQAAKVIGTGS